MRLIDADSFERDLKEKLLPLLVEKYGKEEAMKGLHFSLQDCISNIQGQPTITQPEQRWIQCSEKLPKEHEWMGTKRFGTTISDEVYVTFENPKGERFCKHLSFQNGKLSGFDQSTIDAFYKGSKPIAWMPLPERYLGE